MFYKQTRIFQEGLSKRHEFSRRVYIYVLQTDTNFPGGLIEKTCFFKEVLSIRQTGPYYLIEQTYTAKKTLIIVLGQILIFQEALSSPRTPTIFQETPMPRTHRYFPGRYPLSNRYFVNRSRWSCFR